MRTGLEYSGSVDAGGWRSRHDLGEVPDALPYGFDRLAGLGHELVLAPPLRDPRVRRLARAASHRSGGLELVESLRRARTGGVDVLLCQDERTGLPALLREGLRPGGLPVVTGSVWLADGDGVPGFQARLARRVLPAAAGVWTYSRAEAPALAARYGVRPERVHALDFGVDTDFYTPDPGPGGAADDPALVVSAGNDRHRDFGLLVRALQQVRTSGTALTAVVASSQWSGPAGAPWCRAIPTDNVGVRALYRRAAVVVVPTRPNLHVSGVTVALEAMAVGVPVVVTGTPGFGRYAEHGETALVVPPGDAGALAGAVRELLRDPAGARRMAERARERVLSTFTTGRLATQLDHLLRTVA